MFTARLPLCLLLILLSLQAVAQPVSPLNLSIDSLPHAISDQWQYLPGDDIRRASSAYPDTGWTIQSAYLDRLTIGKDFPGVGWWRKYINVDSSLAAKPLAMIIEHGGASEFYLNGALLHSAGQISKDGQCIMHYTSGGQPFVFVLPHAGTYLLAVRHARNQRDGGDPGFFLSIAQANDAINIDRQQAIAMTTISIFLLGLFLAFSILHGIMYLYYRAGKSNLWFSLFSLGLAVIFAGICTRVMHSLRIVELYTNSLPHILLLTSLALSAFINSVFFKRRAWLRLIIIVALPFTFISRRIALLVAVSAIIAVSIETIITIGFALYRRRPGAKLIASGLLLFALLMLYLFMRLVIFGDSGLAFTGRESNIMFLIFSIATLCMPLSMSAHLAWNFATVSKALSKQLTEVERLSAEALNNEIEKQRLLESRSEDLEREVSARTEDLRRQKQKSDDLLLNILPAEVAEELKEHGKTTAKQYNEVSVLFTDFVDFTQHAESLSPEALVAEIDSCFRAFDDIIGRHGLEKIKTVGDAYIAVSGLPVANASHAQDVVSAALEIRAFMAARLHDSPEGFGIRLGVHSGPVVAGIVGVKKFAYDIWGDTVNTAARMEQHSEPGELNISETTHELIKDSFITHYRGDLEVKHKGKMHMYFVKGQQVPELQ